MSLILLFAVGILVGAMNSIAGGGMLLGFPIMLAAGVPAIAASATTSLVVLPGIIASSFGYRRYFHKVPRQYLLLLIPTIGGAIIGTIILRHTSPTSFEKLVPWLILSAVLLFAFQPCLYSYLHKHIHGPKHMRQKVRPLWLMGLAIFPLAIYGSYFGAGFGFIMLAFLSFTRFRDHMHRMNAIKGIAALCISGTAFVCLLGSNLIDWKHGIPMSIGCLIGGYYGSISAQKVSSHSIRILVIVIGLIATGYLLHLSFQVA